MAKGRYFIGLDIGSAVVRSVVAQEISGETALRVVGVGEAPSFGVRRGTIVDSERVAQSCHQALEQVERMSGVRGEDLVVSVSGPDIECETAVGVIAIGRPDGEVIEDDVRRALEETRARITLPLNREVLHVLPKNYRLDDQSNIKDPIGMKGVRLELTALVVSATTPQIKNLARALDQTGTKTHQYVVEPLAAAEAVLSQKQKELGCVLVNIGGSTTSLAAYEDGDLLHLAVLPVGSGHITNDLAIGLRTSIEVAEAIKLKYGSATPAAIEKREEIDLGEFDGAEEGAVLRRHVAEIIEARLEEIFTFVNAELAKIEREGLLPGGAVITGGGALLPGTVELAKKTLRLPAHIGFPKPLGGILDQVDTPPFATVIGLLLLAQGSILETNRPGGRLLPEGIGGWFDGVAQFVKRFLP